MSRAMILLVLLVCLSVSGIADPELRAAGPLLGDLDLERLKASPPPRGELNAKSLEELLSNARSVRQAAMFVGRSEGGVANFGTAFVISRKHRLLATNAHVADIMKGPGSMLAIPNGTGDVYHVERRWYHPGVRRSADRISTVPSQDPNDGDVVLPCPDVAVLRLADGGPELPAQVTLAGWAEMQDLFAQPVGVIGFPAYNFTKWPGPGTRVVATIQEGIINRLTDYHLEADVPREDLQLIQHSIEAWFGLSGSPMFLANGHVVGLVVGTRSPFKQQDQSIRIPAAVRVDCLWELLVYHKLDDAVAIDADRGRRLAERHLKDDPRSERFLRAARLVREAERLAWEKSHREAIARCEEAIQLAPKYAPAYEWAAEARWLLCGDSGRALGVEEQVRLIDDAMKYMKKCVELEGKLDHVIELLGMNNYRSGLTGDREGYRESLDALAKILALPDLGRKQRGRALQSEAAARWALGDRGAVADYDEAIRNIPDDPFIYEDRAAYYEGMQQHARAAEDRQKAQELRAARLGGSKP
jgi:tetratricopeptide (TPR) repeat protein